MQRKLVVLLVGLGLVAVACAACAPDQPQPTPSPTPGEDMSFQALRGLPEHPPALLVEGETIDPYMVDWRTGQEQRVTPAESINGVPQIKAANAEEIRADLINTATPSGLTIGVYPGSLIEIDPTVPPEITYDCLAAEPCPLTMAAETGTVPLQSLIPDTQSPAVFVITATYFAESAGTPFANTLAWVFELTP